MSTDSNLKTAQIFLNALSGHDRESMASVCHPDFVWTMVPKSMGYDPMEGEEAIDLLSSVGSTVFKPGSLSNKVTRSVVDDHSAVLEVNVKGTTADGKAYDNWYAAWFEFEGGLILRFFEHTDSKYLSDLMSS